MKPSNVIAFRLDPHHGERLRARAERCRQSPGDLARALVRDALEQAEDGAPLGERVDRLAHEVGELRRDLHTALRALLVTAGQVPVPDVEAWAEENLGKSC
jgi:hypothetical protein